MLDYKYLTIFGNLARKGLDKTIFPAYFTTHKVQEEFASLRVIVCHLWTFTEDQSLLKYSIGKGAAWKRIVSRTAERPRRKYNR